MSCLKKNDWRVDSMSLETYLEAQYRISSVFLTVLGIGIVILSTSGCIASLVTFGFLLIFAWAIALKALVLWGNRPASVEKNWIFFLPIPPPANKYWFFFAIIALVCLEIGLLWTDSASQKVETVLVVFFALLPGPWLYLYRKKLAHSVARKLRLAAEEKT